MAQPAAEILFGLNRLHNFPFFAHATTAQRATEPRKR
ncbi:Uncharacterised protein [Vibrio cholerae]|nr:Uncharacterised protein [Vibrio cholerae]